MNQEIVDDLKAMDWQLVINYGQSLTDLNGAQFKFLKGLVIELLIEKVGTGLEYVGEPHKDFNWPARSVSLELKTIMSKPMYKLKKSVMVLSPKMTGIILSNSYGNNTTNVLDPAKVADVLLVIMKDGAYVVSKQTVLDNAKHSGDGWTLKPSAADIIELSGHLVPTVTYETNLAQKIKDVIRDNLPQVDK